MGRERGKVEQKERKGGLREREGRREGRRKVEEKQLVWRNCSPKGSHICSIVVDLPNLGTQHVFILIVLCFHCLGIFGMEIYCNRRLLVLCCER